MMNVLKFGYYRHTLKPRCVLFNIKQFFTNLKFAYQRVTRGYCDKDWWDLDTYYTNIFIGTLTDLAKYSHGYPGIDEFSDEQAQADGYKDGYDRWQKYLLEIVTHLKNLDEDNPDSDYNKRLDSLYQSYRKEHLAIDAHLYYEEKGKFFKYREKEKDIALDMMKKHFFSLWD